MVDLVKIRKKAKEKAEIEAPAPEEQQAPEAAVPPAVKAKKAERRAPVASEQRAASSEEAASKAPKQPATSVPEKPTAPPPPSTEDRPPSTERPSAEVVPPAGRTSARSISKLERYKEQAGKRREIAESVGKTTATTTEETQLEVLTFALAGESYAIEIEKIVEIVPPRAATKVPNATESVVGIISLRGTIVTLIDVRRRLKQATAEPTVDTRIIVLERDGETVGFEVDRVFRVVKIAASDVAPHPVVHASEQDESIRGVFRHGESLTILLDFAKLLGGREVARTGPRTAVASRR